MTLHVVKGNRVLVYPGEKPVLAVDLIQFIYFEAAFLLPHISSQAGPPSVLADDVLSFVKHRWVLVTLEQIPDHPQVGRHGTTVGESARDDNTGAFHAGDAVGGGEVPPNGAYGSCEDNR